MPSETKSIFDTSYQDPKSDPLLWKKIERQNIRSLDALISYLELSKEQTECIYLPKHFTINIPIRLASKMKKGSIEGPIFSQFVPHITELEEEEGFSEDPVCEIGIVRKSSILIHKYHGRVLLITSPSCAMHCRFCFRAHFDYKSRGNLSNELVYINNDTSITEVILSGGDPLSLTSNTIKQILTQISEIKHVQRIRFHSRFPIGIPERIDEAFLELLETFQPRFQFWFILHTNHSSELDKTVLHAVRKIHKLGIPIATHSVLMKGINDDSETLISLFLKLANNGIFPFYLNKLDKVKGAHRFHVETKKAIELMETITKRLPGYAVPKLVEEVPGLPSKMNLGPALYPFTSHPRQ